MGLKRGEDRCGNELPQHTVNFPSGFWMGKYEVTQAQWRSVMGNHESYWRGDDLPAERVTWDDAQNFVRRLTERTGARYRLPTEAEWEYACRAGSTTAYYWGNEMNGAYCWCAGNSSNRTHPVGKTKPNRWGLYDMLGNVYEWCEDVWHINYKGAPDDGSAWTTDGDPEIRVLRGGYWGCEDKLSLRSAERFGGGKDVGTHHDGVRCVLVPDAVPDRPQIKVEFRLAQKTPLKGLVEATIEYSKYTHETIYLHKEALITNADIVEARVARGYRAGIFDVELFLTREAAKRLAEMSIRHSGEMLAMLINGKVVSAPIIIGKISSPTYISGEFTKEEAESIASELNTR